MKNNQINEESVRTVSKRGRKPDGIPFPRKSFLDSLRIPQLIWEKNAGNALKLLDLATFLNYSPSSGNFAMLIRASKLYGLTEGSFAQDTNKEISLSSLGQLIVAPTSETNVNEQILESLTNTRIMVQIFERFEGKIIPPKDIFKNDLLSVFNIPNSDLEPLYNIFIQNVLDLNLFRDNNNKRYLRQDLINYGKIRPNQESDTINDDENSKSTSNENIVSVQTTQSEPVIQKSKKIFLAHGKNKEPLKVITDFLGIYKIPYVVAVDEPHSGRPISIKVSELMDECTSGIFIFTKELSYKMDNKEIYLPNLNVIYELGAASKLYDDRIIIFKEKGIDFGSDFDDLGYITFDPQNMAAKIKELLGELVSLDFINVSVN